MVGYSRRWWLSRVHAGRSRRESNCLLGAIAIRSLARNRARFYASIQSRERSREHHRCFQYSNPPYSFSLYSCSASPLTSYSSQRLPSPAPHPHNPDSTQSPVSDFPPLPNLQSTERANRLDRFRESASWEMRSEVSEAA